MEKKFFCLTEKGPKINSFSTLLSFSSYLKKGWNMSAKQMVAFSNLFDKNLHCQIERKITPKFKQMKSKLNENVIIKLRRVEEKTC